MNKIPLISSPPEDKKRSINLLSLIELLHYGNVKVMGK
jgi:hypothetical protein